MKCSLKLYIYFVVCGCGFSVIQVKALKFTENVSLKGTESQEEIQTTEMDKAQAILTLYGPIFFCID